MAANEFEKAVQKVMDDFHLHPSEEVWQNVEQQIREKKKKRRIFFFLIFSLLGLAIAGYVAMNPPGERNNAPIAATSNDSNQVGTRGQTAKPSRAVNKDSTGITEPGVKQTGVVTKRSKDFLGSETNHKQSMSGKRKVPAIIDRNTVQTKIEVPTKDRDRQNSKIDKDTSNKTLQDGEKVQVTKDSTSIRVLKQDSMAPAISKAVVTKQKKHRDLNWGVQFSSGVSSIAQRLLFFKSTGTTNSASNAGTAGGYPGLPNQQSSTTGAFGFKIGLNVEKKISKKSNLSSGIVYSYLGDHIKIGTKQVGNPPSSSTLDISSYYGSTRQQKFSDHFHFLELPVLYNWRIPRNPDQYLGLDVGLSLGYLVSTNALVYDTTAAGIYYHNKKSFPRTSFNFVTGLFYHLQSKAASVSFGPQFSFGLNKIIKSDLDRRNYLLYAGVGANVFFGKK